MDTPAEARDRRRALVLAGLAVFGAIWAWYLVELHHQAVAHVLEPGILCADGGCAAVLASRWSKVGPVPVSAPAIGAFGGLAVAALAVVGKRLSAGVVALAGLVVAGAGVVAGGYLAWRMAEIGELCRYCLVMDLATVAIFGGSLALWPWGRPAGGWLGGGLGLGLLGVGGITGLAVAVVWPDPTFDQRPVQIVTGDQASDPVPPGHRRIVLPARTDDLPLGPEVPVRGRPDAPVTLIVFEDFECPYCKRLHDSLELALAHRDDVRIAWFDFPMHRGCNAAPLKRDLHPDACAAAVAARCAQDQGRFWEMYDVLYANHEALDADSLASYGEQVGLDVAKYTACCADPATLERVRDSSRVGASLAITGTPTFVLNGRRFVGSLDPTAMGALIDKVLAVDAGQR